MRWWVLLGLVMTLGAAAQEESEPEEVVVEESIKEKEEPEEEAEGEPAAGSAGEEAGEEAEEEEEIFLEWPPLPEWEEGDRERAKNGELVPGESLLLENDEDFVLPPPEPEKPEEALQPEPGPEEMVEIDPTVIESRFLEEYFGQRPASYLMDPQEMLSRQQFRDRESFLEYHAGDSEVNLYVYLFDADQQLPEGYTIERVFEDYFARMGPTAVVFYFLGRPERSEMILSEGIREVVSGEERERALRTSVQEAFEKSDPADQLDNFSVEMSIRLYWFEKAMGGPAMKGREDPGEELEASLPVVDVPVKESEVLQYLTKSLWVVIFLGLTAVLGWIGRVIARRRLRYVFPEVEIEPLLGAPHAAGVGAVISFSSSQLPPSQQRDHVPDYLQRM